MFEFFFEKNKQKNKQKFQRKMFDFFFEKNKQKFQRKRFEFFFEKNKQKFQRNSLKFLLIFFKTKTSTKVRVIRYRVRVIRDFLFYPCFFRDSRKKTWFFENVLREFVLLKASERMKVGLHDIW